jgi:hypothetical protein
MIPRLVNVETPSRPASPEAVVELDASELKEVAGGAVSGRIPGDMRNS